MKKVFQNRKIRIFLIILLLINLGFGVFIALSSRDNNSGKKANADEYALSKRFFEEGVFERVIGEYKSVENGKEGSPDYVGGYWRLTISSEHEGDGPYFNITNDVTSETAFEGKLMYLEDDVMIVEINQDSFSEMPANWERDVDDGYAVMGCIITTKGLELTCRDTTILFIPQ